MPLELPILKLLANKTIVLASASPRRREILESMVYWIRMCDTYLVLTWIFYKKGLKFLVITTLEPDENDPTAYKTRADYVADTAYMKAKEVFGRCEVTRMCIFYHITASIFTLYTGRSFTSQCRYCHWSRYYCSKR